MSRRVQRAFGARLKKARETKGRLQKVLADQLGLSRTSISNIERGTHRVFLDQVYAAAHALRLDITDLLPSVSEVYPELTVHTASDDPLSDTAAVNAREVVRNIQMGLIESKPTRRTGRSAAVRRK